MKEEKKNKELNLLIQEKKVELRKIVKACKYYAGQQVAIVDIFNDLSDNENKIKREIIPHYLSDEGYTNGNPKTIENYNRLIVSGRTFLTNIRLEAEKAFKEQENN